MNFICPFFADCEAGTGRDRRWSARQPHLRADRREVPRRVRTQGQGQAQLSISQGQARLFKQKTFKDSFPSLKLLLTVLYQYVWIQRNI